MPTKTPPISNDTDLLAPPFQAKALHLIAIIERDGLPFTVFETRRSFSRSAALFMQGRENHDGLTVKVGPTVTNARAGESSHNYGLAMDCILDPKSKWWDPGHGATGGWDLGLERGVLVRPQVKLAWELYGRAAKAADLEWGGAWPTFRDWPHVQLYQWVKFRPSDWKKLAEKAVAEGK